jgi:hypothetical protein
MKPFLKKSIHSIIFAITAGLIGCGDKITQSQPFAEEPIAKAEVSNNQKLSDHEFSFEICVDDSFERGCIIISEKVVDGIREEKSYVRAKDLEYLQWLFKDKLQRKFEVISEDEYSNLASTIKSEFRTVEYVSPDEWDGLTCAAEATICVGSLGAIAAGPSTLGSTIPAGLVALGSCTLAARDCVDWYKRTYGSSSSNRH